MKNYTLFLILFIGLSNILFSQIRSGDRPAQSLTSPSFNNLDLLIKIECIQYSNEIQRATISSMKNLISNREKYIEKGHYDSFRGANSSWIHTVEFYQQVENGSGFVILFVKDGEGTSGYLFGGNSAVLDYIPKFVWQKWKDAPSKGEFFHKYINTSRYNWYKAILPAICN